MQFVRNFSALFLQNPLHFPETSCIITNVVTLIAVKREVAARKWQVFRGANVKLGNWRQVTVQINCPRRSEGIDKTWKYPSGKMSHQGEKVPWGICMDAKKHGRKVETTCEFFVFQSRIHTGECTVTACRTGLKSTKRRRLFLWQLR